MLEWLFWGNHKPSIEKSNETKKKFVRWSYIMECNIYVYIHI